MKFSIVTPVYNCEEYITETIESVLSQEGDFEIEYIIQDGLSTDKTIEITKSYVDSVNNGRYPIHCKKVSIQYFSEKDRGMYDAIEKGFAHTTGEVMAYINADDKYLPGAFSSISKTFTRYPDIKWAKGISKLCNENGVIMKEGLCYIYRQNWIKRGIYGRSAPFIQQESVFWRQSLWEAFHPHLGSFRLAGDYALWVAFAKHSPLFSINKHVSVFRRRTGQLSSSMEKYRLEQEKIAPRNLILEKRVVLFFSLRRFLKLNPHSIITQKLFFFLFPFYAQEWYIDFNANDKPVKRIAFSYVA